MATMGDILAVKGTKVVQIGPDATVYEAAVRMNEHRIGGMVVGEEGHIDGMITERDLLRRVLAQKVDPATSLVREVMTKDVVCCRLHTTIEEARLAMKDRRIRHLPVLNEQGELTGIISIGDLNAHEAQSKDLTIHLLNQYISGFASVAGEA